ncbi:MAG: acyl-CoA thioesterase [Promethearchaeota archaeon]
MEEAIKKRILKAKDTIKIKVRFDDTDAMGAVHFKNYLVYFDDGFVAFMRAIENPVESAVKSGIVFPVKKVHITYEESASFGDYIIVETSIKELEEKSITFVHKISRESDNALLANVECVRLVMDLNTKELLNVAKFFAEFV